MQVTEPYCGLRPDFGDQGFDGSLEVDLRGEEEGRRLNSTKEGAPAISEFALI